jgi:F0F1-type ATP synthase assembly protein I
MSLLLAIPALLAVGPLVGLFIGRFLDGLLNTEPYLMYLFIVLGFVAAGREVYGLIKRVSDKV